jgi:hypothetical protein
MCGSLVIMVENWLYVLGLFSIMVDILSYGICLFSIMLSQLPYLIRNYVTKFNVMYYIEILMSCINFGEFALCHV